MKSINYSNYSYWELDQYFKKFDLIIIGSGIVGLSTALSFRKKHRKASILILEAGLLPSGASTKNAGFACFGSPSELLDDISNSGEEKVFSTVEMRWKGLNMLRKRLGDKNMEFQNNGGFELFDNLGEYERCRAELSFLNKKVGTITGLKNTYGEFPVKKMPFSGVKGIILNKHEGQINTGLMMSNLIKLALENGIKILNNIRVTAVRDIKQAVNVESESGLFSAARVVVATNGFSTDLLKINDVKPARAQVLITKPIPNLNIKGTFHYEQGYYYFRNINNRILFGGGRNTDPDTETTTDFGLNQSIQKRLDHLLKTMILSGRKYEVEHRWSGIMGVGSEKKPIIEFVTPNILAAVRMGGMGVAIGSMVGEIAAEKIHGA